MNKVYTIGRDNSCDIIIPDSSDVVSRVHASLKTKGNGKYVLIDQSRNGTYVNGIKMSANEEIPVTRKDVISFAHVRDLDWDQIPKDKDSGMMWIIIAITVLAIACVCYFLFKPKIEPVQSVEEEHELPAETYQPPVAADTAAKETIYVKPKPAPVKPAPAKPSPAKPKPGENTDEKSAKEEPEIVNPLL